MGQENAIILANFSPITRGLNGYSVQFSVVEDLHQQVRAATEFGWKNARQRAKTFPVRKKDAPFRAGTFSALSGMMASSVVAVTNHSSRRLNIGG